jgi:hypothetical protein
MRTTPFCVGDSNAYGLRGIAYLVRPAGDRVFLVILAACLKYVIYIRHIVPQAPSASLKQLQATDLIKVIQAFTEPLLALDKPVVHRAMAFAAF